MTHAGAGRNANLDGLRLIAAGAIVLHHTAGMALGAYPGEVTPPLLSAIAYAGLFFFFGVSGYLHGSLGTRGWHWVARRMARLGIPYAFWSAFSLLWAHWGSIMRGEPLRGVLFAAISPLIAEPARVIFFAGAADILWTLPALFYTAVLAEIVVKSTRLRRLSIGLAFAALVATSFLLGTEVMPANSYVYFVLAARFVLMYLLGMEVRSWAAPHITRTPAYFGALGVSIIISGLIGVGLFPALGNGFVVQQCAWIAVALLLLIGSAAGVDVFKASAFARGGRLMLGVYVTHMIFLNEFASRVGLGTLPSGVWVLLAWTVAFGFSVGATALLSSNRYTRPVVV